MRLQASRERLTVKIMGSKPAGSSTHAAAIRRAHQIADRRAAARQPHEDAVTATLVEYFEAKERADKIRSDAQSRAARGIQVAEKKAALLLDKARDSGQELIEQAEKEAAEDDAQVGQAIRHLRELGEPVPTIAEMTGLSRDFVRAVEREHLPSPDPVGKPTGRSAEAVLSTRTQSAAVPERRASTPRRVGRPE